MRELPILMAADPVRAILAGRKTQVRRPMKPQPACRCGNPNWKAQKINWIGYKYENKYGWFCHTCGSGLIKVDEWSSHGILSPYQVGDLLYVRETWCLVNDTDYGGELWVDYRATPRYDESLPAGWHNAPDYLGALKWRPAIHMPKWVTRLWLEVVKVRVEKLQDITLEDVKAEGIHGYTFAMGVLSENPPDPRWAFIDLWDSINNKVGKRWNDNPYCWVYDFKVAE